MTVFFGILYGVSEVDVDVDGFDADVVGFGDGTLVDVTMLCLTFFLAGDLAADVDVLSNSSASANRSSVDMSKAARAASILALAVPPIDFDVADVVDVDGILYEGAEADADD